MIFKRVFHREATRVTPPVRGAETQLTIAQQVAMRSSMEDQVRADRKRRDATDVRPGEAVSGKSLPGK